MLWRREESLPSAEIQTLGRPAGSLVTELCHPGCKCLQVIFLVKYENFFSFRATEITEVKRMCTAAATFGTTVF